MEISDNSKKKINYVTTKVAKQILGVHELTLHNWEEAGTIDTIRTPGNHRKYNVEKYLKEQEEKPVKKKANTGSITHEIKKKTSVNTVEYEPNTNSSIDDLPTNIQKKTDVCYVRVSCVGNKDVLKNQKNYLQKQHPDAIVIEDIGSINNFNKQGLKNLIGMISSKIVNNVIIANKSNLSKFSIDMLNFLLDQNEGGKVIIENHNDSEHCAKDVIDEILQIMNMCTTELTELKNNINDKTNK